LRATVAPARPGRRSAERVSFGSRARARRQKTGELTFDERLVAMAERGETTLASRPLAREWSGFLKGMRPIKGFDAQKTLDELREDTK